MTEPEVLKAIQELFDSTFVEKVTVTRELTADRIGEWDSIRHIQILLQLEINLGIRFKTGEAWGLKNVGELVDLILKHRNGG